MTERNGHDRGLPGGAPDFDDLVAKAEADFARGDLASAYRKAGFAMANSDRPARALCLMAQIARVKGARRDAQALAAAACRMNPASAEFASVLAICCLDLGDLAGAYDAVEAVGGPEGLSAHTLSRLVQVFHALSQYRRALGHAQALALIESSNAAVQANLGSLLAVCGDSAAAQAAYRSALALDPNCIDALVNLSAMRTASAAESLVPTMTALAGTTADPFARSRLRYAIAKELGDMGDAAGLFAQLAAGKRIWREASRYDPAADQRMFLQLEKAPAILARRPPSAATDRPVFITGMPRSGTTLVERIITQDGSVHSLGETPALSFALNAQTGNATRRMFDADLIGQAWNEVDLARIASDYTAVANRLAGPGGHPLDKTPLNALLIPLIVSTMPQARIIHVQREHMDTVLGNYRTPFAPHSHSFSYAATLEATHAFSRNLSAWAEQCATRYRDQMIIVRYEQIVADPETEARRIYSFLGLAWDPAATDIAANPTPAASASALQVRSPIHDRAIGQWRQYAQWLGTEM